MSKEQTYIDTKHCDHCDEETVHEIHNAGHERDSSNDWEKCLACGYIKFGHSDQQIEPYPPTYDEGDE